MRLPVSGAPWLSNLPSSWPVKPIAALFTERNQRNDGVGPKQLLSLSYGRVVRKDIDANDGLRPESYDTYQQIEADNIVLRLIDLQNDKRSIRAGQATERGIITSAYVTLDTDAWACPRYAFYLLLVLDQLKVFYGLGSGMRQSITFSDLGRVPVGVPSSHEQLAIATYLDVETVRIDGLIEEKKKLKALLAELRSATITDAVMGRIDVVTGMARANAEGGGVMQAQTQLEDRIMPAWESVIPDTWAVKRVKHVARFTTGWTPPSGDVASYTGENPWATIGDLGPKVLCDTANHISDEAAAKSSIPLSPPGSLLFSFKLSVGQVSIAGRPMFTNEAIATFAPEDGYDTRWAFYAFPEFIPENSAVNIYGARLLNQQRINDAALPFPPLGCQHAIASYLDAETARIDMLMARVDREIELLNEFRSATITDAVLGRIDVRDYMKN